VQCTGAKLTVVGDGQQAVEHALAGDYDLVLMDIQMPVMDGVAAITLLRQAGYSSPIVALTANVMREDIEKYRSIGCNDVLAKPIDRARFYATLQRHLEQAQAATKDDGRDAQIDEVVERLAASFRSELPGTIEQLQRAAAGQLWEELRRLAHRIKGLAGSIGYPEFTQLAQPLEACLIKGDHEAAQVHCARLVAALTSTSEAAQPAPEVQA
jgi:CheY-like chemotaxis protein/HPt (histidine-containing phosphotransfer) domain-containing protein